MPDDDQRDSEKAPAPPRSGIRRALDFAWFLLKDQWFLVGIGVVTLIASQVQVPLAQQNVKQLVVSYLSVSLVFFVAGCTIDTSILLANYAKWKHHLFIQLQCFLMVSALAYAVVRLAAISPSFMDPWLLIGMIFNGCQPTAMASNVQFTRQSHGETALTVVETTIGNLIGPFVTPVLIRMYLLPNTWFSAVIPSDQSNSYQALYSRVFMQFGLSIYLPMLLGQLFRHFFPKLTKTLFVDYKLSKIGSLCMLTLLWQTFDRAFATNAFNDVKSSNLVFIVFVTICNWSVWLLIAFGLSVLWLGRKETVAVVMCVPAKTLALGMPLSFLMFEGISELEEAKIQVPMLIFQVEMLGLASISTLFFRRWVAKGERKERARADEEGAVGGGGDGGRQEGGEKVVGVRASEKDDIPC
ncbi:uncharacterized protein AB675_1262 [Cyphellophora attinorum]|uniref:Putative membrane protein n=1 Tax=Cyphellophora attinorum TaxID=1664694 RepID=A0A0N1H2Z0_9EURO|nr:uncharacterized protein AB675_1262 [Phialophora attinorum]KPI35766.1 putative membrane protein [Phialophora attinorum]